jgi:hypothetical protein
VDGPSSGVRRGPSATRLQALPRVPACDGMGAGDKAASHTADCGVRGTGPAVPNIGDALRISDRYLGDSFGASGTMTSFLWEVAASIGSLIFFAAKSRTNLPMKNIITFD